MAKIAFTVFWAGLLIVVNKVLDEATWAQYLATFVLAGMYAYAIGKMPGGNGKSVQEGSER
ncbi:hypothetical protein QOM21_17030 [Streptomyces sp. Pv4-95]|uniref:hypothetical protein n=1 Tax=Streptomyces sp. Pv4-95 TaxID=3049543 RepID=UPI003891ADB9